MELFFHALKMVLLLGIPLLGFEIVGVGGFEYKSPSTKEFTPISTLIQEAQLDDVNSVSLWITREWSENWYPASEVNQHIVEKGYTPIFIVYWFADDISVDYIQKHDKEYYGYLKRLRRYLDEIKGKKIIVLNPEYNQFGVEGWSGFNQLLLNSKKILDHGDILIGPCVGDFGNYDLVFDPLNWKNFDTSIKNSIQSFDFIAFQEMRSLTKDTPEQIRKLPPRIESFSAYLHATYEKPVLLAYLALSSWGAEGETLQKDVFERLAKRQNILMQSGMIGMNLFHLVDVSSHVGYFGLGEKHFGIYRSDLTVKSSVYYFKQIQSQKKIK